MDALNRRRLLLRECPVVNGGRHQDDEVIELQRQLVGAWGEPSSGQHRELFGGARCKAFERALELCPDKRTAHACWSVKGHRLTTLRVVNRNIATIDRACACTGRRSRPND